MTKPGSKQSPRRHTEHLVQLFDSPESLCESVGAFLHGALHGGAHLLVVAKPANAEGIGEVLRSLGHDPAALIEQARLTVLNARLTLSSFMRNGLPVKDLFDANVGELVKALCADAPVPLHVYGEMVELLAEEGNFRGAGELERLWNELAEGHSFTLLCGYSSAHFAPVDAAAPLQHICRAHTRINQSAADFLGTWLLASRGQLAS